MAAGHPGAHLGSVRLGGGGMVADSSHTPDMTHLPHLSGMGPQTLRVGDDARWEARTSVPTHRIPGGRRGVRRHDAEPAPVLRPRPSPGQAPLSMGVPNDPPARDSS